MQSMRDRVSLIRRLARVRRLMDAEIEAEGDEPLPEIEGLERRSRRSGPDEGDREAAARYVGMLPDETGHEEPSPLRFL